MNHEIQRLLQTRNPKVLETAPKDPTLAPKHLSKNPK